MAMLKEEAFKKRSENKKTELSKSFQKNFQKAEP